VSDVISQVVVWPFWLM